MKDHMPRTKTRQLSPELYLQAQAAFSQLGNSSLGAPRRCTPIPHIVRAFQVVPTRSRPRQRGISTGSGFPATCVDRSGATLGLSSRSRWHRTSNEVHCYQRQRKRSLPPIVSMPKWLIFCVAVLCLVWVVAICIAPDVDLPDTVLRATQLTLLLLLATLAMASLWTGKSFAWASRPNIGLSLSETAHVWTYLPKLARNCVFLC